MRSLRFTSVELDANREGRLTDAQRKRLDADVDRLRKYSTYLGVGGALLIAVCFIIGACTSNINTGGYTLAVSGLALVICLGIVLAWNRWMLYRYARGHIHVVEGNAEVINLYSNEQGLRAAIYKVRIWRMGVWWTTFRFIDADSLRYFKTGQRHRVYYLLHYRVPYVLSVEEIPNEKAKR